MSYKDSFSNSLIAWFKKNKRDLPWRKTKNPYFIWLSEVMLQQTQVKTVIPYYLRFIKTFPTIQSLAEANMNDLMKAWEGLGYYSRARNLQHAAKTIISDFGGTLPQTRDELLTLKGFGAYTSASVASIAFGQAHAAIDGNVLRVFARIYAIADDIRMKSVKDQITDLAESLLPRKSASAFNEAVMELGATICTPRNPVCAQCPISTFCKAYQEDRVSEFPYKSKLKATVHHHIAIGVIHKKGKILVALRAEKGLLGNLWEFPGGKLQPKESLEDCCKREIKEETGLVVKVGAPIASVKHAYTHFKITLHAFHCEYVSGVAKPKTSQKVRWAKLNELSQLPFPKANKIILEKLLNS